MLLGNGFGSDLFAVPFVDAGPLNGGIERCAPPSVFFAVLVALFTGFLPGYLFPPRGVLLVLAMSFVPLGLVDAGSEFERLMTGLRAVEGRGLGEGL